MSMTSARLRLDTPLSGFTMTTRLGSPARASVTMKSARQTIDVYSFMRGSEHEIRGHREHGEIHRSGCCTSIENGAAVALAHPVDLQFDVDVLCEIVAHAHRERVHRDARMRLY